MRSIASVSVSPDGKRPSVSLVNEIATACSPCVLSARCQTWAAEHYDEPNPVTAPMRPSGRADRLFNRRFQQATGMSPLEDVHALRFEEVTQLLAAGEQPVETITQEVGYEEAAYFSRLFRRKVNLNPNQCRKRFGALRRTLASVEAV